MSGKADVRDSVGRGEVQELRHNLEKMLNETGQKVDSKYFEDFEARIQSKVEEIQALLTAKSNIKDVCTLLDMKSNIEDVNKALAEVSEALETRVVARDFREALAE